MCNIFNQVIKTLLIAFYSVFFAIAVTACGGGGGGGDTTVADLDCSVENPDTVCLEDVDDDGMTYKMETDGWEVWPDRFGLGQGTDTFGQMDAHYLVTSNPELADTDGDGLSDFDEFLNKTDPTMVDTDGDGLTDSEELNRWASSPLSVDTDGDSRGPDKDLVPNSLLFDSAELKIDLLGDPSHTPGKGATSPNMEDSDGDSYSDYYEITQTQGSGFNPVLADLPKIDIDIVSSPLIRLTGTYESGGSWQTDLTMTDTLSQSIVQEAGVSRTTEFAIGNTTEVGAEIGFEAGQEGANPVVKVTGSASMSYSVSMGMTSSDAISWSKSNAQTAEKAYQESIGQGGFEAVTLDGGYISVNIDITNSGNLAYTLNDLRVSILARYIDGSSNFTSILELQREENISVSMAPGDTLSNILLKSSTNDYALIHPFIKNPTGLLFEVASFNLTDQNDVSFVFNTETIKQRTALVVIDYGGEAAPGRYLVSTSPHLKDDGLSGITLPDIFSNVLDIEYTTEELSTAAGSYSVISGITPPGALTSVDNDKTKNKKWLVAISTNIENPELPDVDSLLLKAGDSISLMYVKDVDHDKLSAREEALNGTKDMEVDTDGDGLSDYEEIRTGWTINVEGQDPYTAHSRGFSDDFDQDTLDDSTEKTCGMDPVLDDTDQDGILDQEEMLGYDIIDENNVVVLHIYPYAGAAILDGGNGVIDSTLSGDDIALTTTPETGSVLFGPGPNGVMDTIPAGDDYIGVPHNELVAECHAGSYATNPLSDDTDGDTTTDSVEREDALGSPNNPGDSDLYIDKDGDGLSDAVEKAGFKSLVNGIWYTFTSDHEASAPGADSRDTDNDGLPDLLEYLLKSNPRSVDTDGDGLSDLDEYDFVTSMAEFETKCAAATKCLLPPVQGEKHGTALTNRDTDTDGLHDGDEIAGWTVRVYNKLAYQVYPDPLDANSDNDGLNDLSEKFYLTDPLMEDTDSDGTEDGVELGIWSDGDGLYGTVSGQHRDPLTPDMRVTLSYNKIDAGSNLCNIWSTWIWYYFWLDVTLPDGTTVHMVSPSDYCDQNCEDYAAFQGSFDLTTISPENKFAFLMKKNGEEFSAEGFIKNITTAADPACWFVGANCSTASWDYRETYTSAMVSSSTKYITGGGSSCLADDEIEIRIDVD